MAETPNMGLDKPVVSGTLGPEWASLLNALIDKLDAHDHSEGEGVKVTPSGILINSSLDFLGEKIKNALTVGLSSQASADLDELGSLQRVDGNLYWINPSGTAVQLTNGNAVISPGSGALSYDLVSSYPYTVVSGDNATVKGIDTSAARVINLPAATTAMYVYFKDVSQGAQANPFTVNPNGSDTVDGVNAAFTIDWNDAYIGFISDGVSRWWVM